MTLIINWFKLKYQFSGRYPLHTRIYGCLMDNMRSSTVVTRGTHWWYWCFVVTNAQTIHSCYYNCPDSTASQALICMTYCTLHYTYMCIKHDDYKRYFILVHIKGNIEDFGEFIYKRLGYNLISDALVLVVMLACIVFLTYSYQYIFDTDPLYGVSGLYWGFFIACLLFDLNNANKP